MMPSALMVDKSRRHDGRSPAVNIGERPRSTLLLLRVILVALTTLVAGAVRSPTSVSATKYTYDAPAISCVDVQRFGPAEAGSTPLIGSAELPALPSMSIRGTSTTPVARSVATNTAGLADDAAGVAFRTDTSHIFRNAAGHLADDTAANRALIQSAVNPGNLVAERTIGSSVLRSYQRLLPDGRQIWVEVRNGVEITNGGVNTVAK